MPEETLRYDPHSGSWLYPAHWDEDTTGLSAELDRRIAAQETAKQPTCPRCHSPRWVSVSLDGGYTRRAQCVPCGAMHTDVIGPGWKSARFDDPDAQHPDYRTDRT